MKSPLRYSKWLIIIYFIVGFLVIGVTFNAYYLSGAVITLSKIVWNLIAILLFTLCGWYQAVKFTGTILHRKVNHPVDPHRLVPNKIIYWLNGETRATFVGVMDYTGKYLFHVHGYHKKNDVFDAQDLSPDQVRDYISTQKEI